MNARQRITLAAAVVVAVTPVAATPARAAVLAPAVAATPPLGWNSWNTYGCAVDENLVKAQADAMVSSGMRDAGYRYVVVDDCWQAPQRDAAGDLQPHPDRFPSGIRALADHVHDRGLKLGIYGSPGTKTCGQLVDGYPGASGSAGHEEQDARRFADWQVDYLKYDWCSAEGDAGQRQRFEKMRDALAATGRPMVYSINSNSGFAVNSGLAENWRGVAHLWRTSQDIVPAWDTGRADAYPMGVVNILDLNAGQAHRAAPGGWNDPDMLEVGVRRPGYDGLTDVEGRAHFSLWAIMAAPLIAGNDLTTMSAATRETLTNPEVVAIDQDRLGAQGVRVRDDGDTEVWARQLHGAGMRAVALFNRGAGAAPMTVRWPEIGLAPQGAAVRDLWARADRGTFADGFTTEVPGHGVVLLRVTGTDAPATVDVRVTDPRPVTGLSVTAEFAAVGDDHAATRDVGELDRHVGLALTGAGGAWDAAAGRWTGDFLTVTGRDPGAPGFTVTKTDPRPFHRLRITVRFSVDGQPHHDWQDVGSPVGPVRLRLDATGGSWDGSRWVGDFLRDDGAG
jgi:alpha-galactosidase